MRPGRLIHRRRTVSLSRRTRPRRVGLALAPLLWRARRPRTRRLRRIGPLRDRPRPARPADAAAAPASSAVTDGRLVIGGGRTERTLAESRASVDSSALTRLRDSRRPRPRPPDASAIASRHRIRRASSIDHGGRTASPGGEASPGRTIHFGLRRTTRDRRKHLKRSLGRRSMGRLGRGMRIIPEVASPVAAPAISACGWRLRFPRTARLVDGDPTGA